MKNTNIWSLVNTALIVVITVLFFLSKDSKKKGDVFFIDNIALFNEFNMTKDLGNMNEEKYKGKLKQFDSLVNVFNDLESKLKLKKKISAKEETEYVQFHRVLREQEQEIEGIKIAVKNEINQKVWSRLNTYMDDYGKKNELRLVLGAQGKGNIMYGDSLQNLTKDFIKYANKRYEGE